MQKHTGNEVFENDGMFLDFNLLDFWQWYASDLLNHPIRGAIAEFVVAKALGIPTDEKPGWKPYDLLYRSKRLEIKSCAVVSDSHGGKSSRIVFSIKKQLCLWDEDVEDGYCTKEELWEHRCRHSAFYVFCFLKEEDGDKANPMMLDQWEFFILPTSVIDRELGDQQTIRIPTILSLGGVRCSWADLKERMDAFIGEEGGSRE